MAATVRRVCPNRECIISLRSTKRLNLLQIFPPFTIRIHIWIRNLQKQTHFYQAVKFVTSPKSCDIYSMRVILGNNKKLNFGS